MTAVLPTNLEDPLDRLAVVHASTQRAKEEHGALPADVISELYAFAMPSLVGLAARANAQLRLLERVAPFNLFVSNVPGPSVPLFVGGAEVIASYPVSAITDGQGLNITVVSYLGGMHFGLISDRTSSRTSTISPRPWRTSSSCWRGAPDAPSRPRRPPAWPRNRYRWRRCPTLPRPEAQPGQAGPGRSRGN